MTSRLAATAAVLVCGVVCVSVLDRADAAPPKRPVPKVFVSPSGSDSGRCTQVAPCASFDRAYRVASAGQVVEVAGGSYPDQTLNRDGSKTGPGHVVFQPAAGASVSVSNLYLEGASFVTFRGMSAGNRLQVENTDPGTPGSTDVDFDSMSAQTIRIVGQVSNISIHGGSFGSTVDNQPQVKKYNQSDPESSRPSNILVDGAFFHDFTRSGSTVHTECFQIINVDTITIRNSRFNHCDGTGDIGITDGPSDNLTFENDFFGMSGDAYYAMQITKNVRNLVLRYNSSSKAIIFSDTESGGPYTFVGNYMPFSSQICDPNATYSHNVWAGGTCGPTDLNVSSLQFVDAADFNLHLKPGAPGYCRGDWAVAPRTDIDGQIRSRLRRADAGADQLPLTKLQSLPTKKHPLGRGLPRRCVVRPKLP